MKKKKQTNRLIVWGCVLLAVLVAGLLVWRHVSTTKENKKDVLNDLPAEYQVYPPTVFPAGDELEWKRELQIEAVHGTKLTDLWTVKNNGSESVLVTVAFPQNSNADYTAPDGRAMTDYLYPAQGGELSKEALESGQLFRDAVSDWDGTTQLEFNSESKTGMRFCCTQFTLEPNEEKTLSVTLKDSGNVVDLQFLSNWQAPACAQTTLQIQTGEETVLSRQTVTEALPDGNPLTLELGAAPLSGTLCFRIK